MREFKRWSDEDFAVARKMLDRNAKNEEFVAVLGRTKNSALMRRRYLDDPAYRAKTKQRASLQVRNYGPAEPVSRPRSVPDDVVADAERRRTAERSLTAQFCGDPVFADSALGKKMMGVQT